MFDVNWPLKVGESVCPHGKRRARVGTLEDGVCRRAGLVPRRRGRGASLGAERLRGLRAGSGTWIAGDCFWRQVLGAVLGTACTVGASCPGLSSARFCVKSFSLHKTVRWALAPVPPFHRGRRGGRGNGMCQGHKAGVPCALSAPECRAFSVVEQSRVIVKSEGEWFRTGYVDSLVLSGSWMTAS